MDGKLHAAGVIAHDGIRMGGAIVEQLGDGLSSGFSSFGLCRGKSAEGYEKSGVDGASVIQEGANNFLESGDASGVEGSGGVFVFRKLRSGAVGGFDPSVRRMLWTGRCRMMEFVEGIGDVSGHGEIDGAVDIVPGEGDAAVDAAGPISGDGVEVIETGDKVLGMLTPDVLDAEIVNNKSEGDWSSVVRVEAWSVFGGTVSVLGKVKDETIVGKDAGLG